MMDIPIENQDFPANFRIVQHTYLCGDRNIVEDAEAE